METIYPAQETLGSTVLLMNNNTISNKLLTLASPKPRRPWICRQVKIAVPSIGIIWYLPMSWLVHSYLEMTCIREMDLIRPSHLTSVIQVMIALSVVVLVFFTISAVLRIGQSSDDTMDTYLKRPSVKYFLQAIRSQMYPLQALAAFILVNIYLLIQIDQFADDSLEETSDNETVTLEKNGHQANSSDTEVPLLPLPAEKRLTFLAFCGHFAIPLIIYAIQESEMLWQKEKIWGFLYSFILLLSPLKYLCSSLMFYVISVTAHKSPKHLLFQGVSKWLPPLYLTSALSLFLFSLALKIYIEIRLNRPAASSSTTNITLRRKIYYPSPLGVISSSVLILGSEIPSILHFIHFILRGSSEILIVCLLSFSTAFCLIILTASLVVGFKKNCHNTRSRIKKKRIDSGVCLANSFVYQAKSEAGKSKC